MIQKEYTPDGNCSVKFLVPSAVRADIIYLVVDFNSWNPTNIPMQKSETGDFEVTLVLESNREFQFLYLVNETDWHSDWDADKYVPNPYEENNSIVVT
ncbi:MAG: isoamylase early set domain-containing protein [Anaerolineae bacterium]